MPFCLVVFEKGNQYIYMNVYIIMNILIILRNIEVNIVFLCGSVVEHCVSSAKGCGFDSQGMKMYNLNVIVSRFG